MNSRTAAWLIVIGFFWLASCHKPRTKSRDRYSQSDTARTAFSDSLLAHSAIEEIDFDYLTAKSKFSFKSRSQNIDNANVNIRIKKDSLIWLSVTGVGLEVARGIITPDSIVFMDKFHKEYYVFSYAQLSQQFKFDLNFPLLQSLIVGNLPIPRDDEQKFRREKDFLLLRQNQGRILVDNYIGTKNRKLKRLTAVEQPTRNTLNLDYEDFTQLNNYLFPYTSLLTLDVQSEKDQQYYQTVIRIKHSRVELAENPLSFPFSIPASYKRKL
ncbi:hypothetical protein GCM10027275_02600 [Rhabdobacter roseus]|uniref:DUF4292 domain-containing protein n=1 Tax=Rhabdobacter roseus TaxID=1655419 RepID=A0A840TQ56_9BACT|nr:DUF4292 domain-containing protein [Rhabdobacter roseus]MBB5282148.1 hypothetical protein [Rhabdobacter roseus]